MQPKLDTRLLVEDGSNAAMGARLAIIRHEIGKTQLELAAELNVSPRSYHHYEKGGRGCPADKLAILASKYGIDLNWLVLGIEQEPSPNEMALMEDFAIELDRALSEDKISLSTSQRKAVLAKWLQGRQHRRIEKQDDVKIWIEMVR